MLKAIAFLIFNIAMIIPRLIILLVVSVLTVIGMLAISFKDDTEK